MICERCLKHDNKIVIMDEQIIVHAECPECQMTLTINADEGKLKDKLEPDME